MSAAKSEKRDRPAKVSYRLPKTRRAAIERTRALGRLDPFAAPVGHANTPQRKQAGVS